MSIDLTLELILAGCAICGTAFTGAALMIKAARRNGVIDERLEAMQRQLDSRRDDNRALAKELHGLTVSVKALIAELRGRGHIHGSDSSE